VGGGSGSPGRIGRIGAVRSKAWIWPERDRLVDGNRLDVHPGVHGRMAREAESPGESLLDVWSQRLFVLLHHQPLRWVQTSSIPDIA
jgi:hypothetical protein